MGHWKTMMRELAAEARLHRYARTLSGRTGARTHSVAFYSVLAVIAVVVLGTISIRPF
jgi:hypothetical protein